MVSQSLDSMSHPTSRTPLPRTTLYKSTLVFALFALLCNVTSAQSGHVRINESANCLKFDSSAVAMKNFFTRWNSLDKDGHGRMSIMHIGGSHVQAGTMSHRIRKHLVQRCGASDRGLVFPYSAAAKCNNPADYRISCKEKMGLTRNVYKEPQKQLGLCGIAVTAADTHSTIRFWNNDTSIDWHTDRIVVMGYSPEGVVPTLLVDEREVWPSYVDEASRRFVFNLRNEVDSFAVVLPCDSLHTFTLTGIYLGNRKPGVSFHSVGVNGAAVPDYLNKCPYLVEDLKIVHPDMVIFGIGINDAAAKDFDTAAFRRNYLALCDSIRLVSPDCAFVFITNNDSFKRVKRGVYHVNRNGLLARDVFYRLAKETGGAVWDQFEIMGGLESMNKWRLDKLAQNDRIHFTRAGYELLADLFAKAFFSTAKTMGSHSANNSKATPSASTDVPYLSY